MKNKVFTKPVKVLIVGTLIIMACTKGNLADWLQIAFTGVWLMFTAVYLIKKSCSREDPSQDEPADTAEEDSHDPQEESDPLPNPSEAEVWYRMVGSQMLTDAITDLNTRGIKKLEIKENGDIIVSDSTVDTIDTLPDKSLWDTLADLMRADGLTASVGHNAIQISW